MGFGRALDDSSTEGEGRIWLRLAWPTFWAKTPTIDRQLPLCPVTKAELERLFYDMLREPTDQGAGLQSRHAQ